MSHAGESPFAIDIEQWVRLGGARQRIRVLAAAPALPVLLVLHGGPGFPNGDVFLRRHARLAQHFTVVTWDQRGAGDSAWAGGCTRLTLSNLESDAAELVARIRAHHSDQDLYVLGLSWGSELGVALVRDHPEGITAYIGSGQAVYGPDGERLSYQASWRSCRSAFRDTTAPSCARLHALGALAALSLVGPPKRAQYRPRIVGLAIQRRILHKFGPHHSRTASTPPVSPTQEPRPRRHSRVSRAWGILRSLHDLWPTATDYDFRRSAATLTTPVWFLQGRHDWVTPSPLVTEYAAELRAPRVQTVWFENSGHSPSRDEPQKFERELIAVQYALSPDRRHAHPQQHEDDTP